jgi:hypothetical protein
MAAQDGFKLTAHVSIVNTTTLDGDIIKMNPVFRLRAKVPSSRLPI